MPRIKKDQPARKAPKVKTVLSPADQERVEELTGGSARSLKVALDQWENERAALAALHDENNALSIYFRRMGFLITLMGTIISQMEKESSLFMTPAMRKAVDNYRDQLTTLTPVMKEAEEIARART